jgi:aconitate hydratase
MAAESLAPALTNSFRIADDSIDTTRGRASFWNIKRLGELGCDVESLPFSIRILLENAVRHSGRVEGAEEAAYELMKWPAGTGKELPFMPSRVLLQDYTGVPLAVDLAGLRDAVRAAGLDPRQVNSSVPVDLIIDHSVQVDRWAAEDAVFVNLEKEYQRNSERYSLLKWAQSAISNMRIFPPGKGICHQVNLEYITTVATVVEKEGSLVSIPDTLVGTDSHTTMVNGLGVVGWGVGGIEAEAVMLGEPYHMPIPEVTGVRITGSLREGATPTDVVLSVTEALRRKGVVGKFVEFFGDGFHNLTVPDRATIGNMSPEYGATIGYFPVDLNSLDYLRGTGRTPEHVDFVRRYCSANLLFYGPEVPEPKYSEILTLDLSEVEPSLAGPRNPDERVPLRLAPDLIPKIIAEQKKRSSAITSSRSGIDNGYQPIQLERADAVSGGAKDPQGLSDGAVIIAAITSCTNTSNPTVMVGAGLMAKRVVSIGLRPKAHVKTSMAPGSRVVTDYLENSGLLPYLDRLGFNVVGYGCTTCIGNSGPLAPEVEKEVKGKDLYAVAVLSGNRNFDGRIHPLAKGSFLTSPMLVVAYSLAGRIDFDFENEPLGISNGEEVYLKDIWPSMSEVKETVRSCLNPELYVNRYSDATQGDERWKALPANEGEVYSWNPDSTYIRRPPWFDGADQPPTDIHGARVLAMFEDKVTTDHISPAGSIPYDSPAGRYLRERSVEVTSFSTYGSRRGNHELMVRGGFSNIRLRNLLAGGKEGGWTTHQPSGQLMTIYDAAVRYSSEGVPLIVIAGKEYGAGSSRDWAAKAPMLLGVKAVLAESFERIHRSNLVAMGILPLEFQTGEGWKSLGLDGSESYDIIGIDQMNSPLSSLKVRVNGSKEKVFEVTARVDNASEVKYYRSGGVLRYVYNKLTKRS